MRVRGQGQASRRGKVPNCTHIDMDREYGRSEQCYVCGRVPSIGFLYICRQDDVQVKPTISELLEGKSAGGEQEGHSLAAELQRVGLSESVIDNAVRGLYTHAQLEKLKAQKLELKQTIEDWLSGQQINAMAAKLMDTSVASPTNTDGAFASTPEKLSPRSCSFRACHSCRPYYRDRIYTPLASIFTRSSPRNVTPSEAAYLPIKDAIIMRNVGLLPNPSTDPQALINSSSPSTMPASTDLSSSTDLANSRNSVLTFKTTQSDISVLKKMRSPRRGFYALGNKSSGSIARNLANRLVLPRGLKQAIQSVFNINDRESSSEGSSITLPLPRTGTARDLTVGDSGERVDEFDLAPLRKVRRQKERVDLKNGSAPNGGFEMGPRAWVHLQCGVHKATNTADMDGNFQDETNADVELDGDDESDTTVYSCASEGSEVEVRNGVALTEEAVETHTPDIFNADSEKGEELGMVNLMTQV